ISRSELRCEVVHAQSELVEQAVVERKVALIVVAHRAESIGREEAVHRAVVPLGMKGGPIVKRVVGYWSRNMVRHNRTASPVRLGIAGRHAIRANERCIPQVMIKRSVLVAPQKHMLD